MSTYVEDICTNIIKKIPNSIYGVCEHITIYENFVGWHIGGGTNKNFIRFLEITNLQMIPTKIVCDSDD